MIVVNRFQIPPSDRESFASELHQVAGILGGKEGCAGVDFGVSLDDAQLWVLVSRWRDVGSYRRALGGYESKAVVIPFLSRSLDQASAYETPEHVGENVPRSW